MQVCRIVFVSINFARSRDPAFYLIAVRILLNQSIRVFFSNDFFFFFLLSSSSSSLFRRFRPPTGQRDLRVVVVRSISSKRVVNGGNDVHDDERVRVQAFFSSSLSFFLSLVLSTQKMKNHIFCCQRKEKCSTDISAFRRSATMIVVFREETQPFSRWP